jgi:hypothetical protein
MKSPSPKPIRPRHAYGVDNDAGPAPKFCSRLRQFPRNATWQILESAQARAVAHRPFLKTKPAMLRVFYIGTNIVGPNCCVETQLSHEKRLFAIVR